MRSLVSIEQQSPRRPCDIFLCLDDLNRERSKISVSPFCNGVVCCLNSESTTLYPSRSLYFISGLDKECTVVEGITPSVSTEMKPCVIIVTLRSRSLVSEALEACSKIRQPIEYLEIRGPRRSFPGQNFPPSKKCHLMFNNLHDLRFTHFAHLLAIQDSISTCTRLRGMSIVHCFIPDHFFDNLKNNTEMERITVAFLVIQVKGSDTAKKTLCKQLKYLTKLENLILENIILQNCLGEALESDTFSRLTCLRKLSLSQCRLSPTLVTKLMKQISNGPLEYLDVSNNFLKGSIHELSKIPGVNYPHLRKFICVSTEILRGNSYCSDLGRADILGLKCLIQEDKLPVLQKLVIVSNKFDKERDTLEKLLKSCERMPSGRQCKIQVARFICTVCTRRIR